MTAEKVLIENEFLHVETAGIDPIPEDSRHTTPAELGGVWAGAFMNYASLLTGSILLTLGLGIVDSLLAVLTGAGLAALLLGFLSVSGPRGGVPQIVFTRRIFGHRGAYLPGVLTLFLAVGWFAVDCVIATNALDRLVGLLGMPTSKGLDAALLLSVVVFSVLVAMYGHRTVVVFERYGAIVFLAFSALLLVTLFPKIHWHLGASVTGSAHVGAWLLGASIVFALVASWFSFAADYSRYLPTGTSTRAVAGWVTAGAGLPAAALGGLGILLFSIDTSTGDLLTTIVHVTARPLGVAFLLFVALSMIWANYLDVYTAGLVTMALDVRLSRARTALLAGVAGGLLAYYALFASSFYSAYQNFLLVTYIWAPAWAAIILIHLFTRRGRAHTPAQGAMSWPAILALVLGTIAAVPFVNSSLWQSPLAVNALHGADLSGLVSFVAGGAIYVLLRPRASTP